MLSQIIRSSKVTPIFVAIGMASALSACGSGSNLNVQIPGVTGPNVSFVNNSLLMSAVIQNVTINAGATVPIPNMPNSTVEVGPDFQSNGLLLSVSISADDLKKILGNTVVLDPNTLPGGRPLPGVLTGQLPSIAVQVPQLDNMTIYIGTSSFGAFVPVKLGMQGYMATFRFYDSANDPIGNLSIVGEDTAGKNSGFLLLINLQGTVGNLIGLN